MYDLNLFTILNDLAPTMDDALDMACDMELDQTQYFGNLHIKLAWHFSLLVLISQNYDHILKQVFYS